MSSKFTGYIYIQRDQVTNNMVLVLILSVDNEGSSAPLAINTGRNIKIIRIK